MSLKRRQTGIKNKLIALSLLTILLINLGGCSKKETTTGNQTKQLAAKQSLSSENSGSNQDKLVNNTPTIKNQRKPSKVTEVKALQSQTNVNTSAVKTDTTPTPPPVQNIIWQDYGAKEPGWLSPMQDNGEIFIDWAFCDYIPKYSISNDKGVNVNSIGVKNCSQKNMVLKPINIEISICKISGDKEICVFKYELPAISGIFKGRGWYAAEFPPWSFRDSQGNLVSPGKYEIDLNVSPIQYYFEDDKNMEYTTESADHLCGVTGFTYKPIEFELTK